MNDYFFENVTEEQVKQYIEEAVEKGIEKLLLKYDLIDHIKYAEPKYVTMQTLSEELDSCRQAIYNWIKHPQTKGLIVNYIKIEGKKKLYDLSGLKKLIRDYPGLFSNGKDHKYRDAVRTNEDKRLRVLSRIASKIHDSKTVTEEEEQYFKDENGADLFDPDFME